MNCNFCRYNTIEPERIVYEDEDFMAFTENHEGECILITKDHIGTLENIPNSARFLLFIEYLSNAIKEAVAAEKIKVITKPGEHISVHIIPEGGSASDDFQEKIMWNLRNSQWYKTLND